MRDVGRSSFLAVDFTPCPVVQLRLQEVGNERDDAPRRLPEQHGSHDAVQLVLEAVGQRRFQLRRVSTASQLRHWAAMLALQAHASRSPTADSSSLRCKLHCQLFKTFYALQLRV